MRDYKGKAMKMTVEEAKEKLAHFASKDKERQRIFGVHFNGDRAYVTDGRIAFRADLDSKTEKDSEEFPFNPIDEFMGVVEDASQWMAMDWDRFMKLGEVFLSAMRDYEVEQRSQLRTRYKHADCPCCGASLYWDSELDELKEFEDVEQVDYNPAHVDFPVSLHLQDGNPIHVAFGYLYLIRKAFGTDVLFSKEVVKEGYIARLLIKTVDGSVKGVMMPLRIDDRFVGKGEINLREVNGSEKDSDGTSD